MSKILGSWSGMRKYLEKEMLAESLQGRIRYNCTRYVGMDMDHIFGVFIDDVLVKQFSYETLNTYFINQGYKNDVANLSEIQKYWNEFWELFEKYPMETRVEYSDEEFSGALKEYRNQSIEKSISSSNPIVRMFAILDRRIGKRALKNQKNNIEFQPEWLQQFYRLRIEAESIV